MRIAIVGFDPSFTNLGIARFIFDTEALRGQELELVSLRLVKTEKTKLKTVRSTSDDLRRAKELSVELARGCEGCMAAASEVPSGAQSARAAWCLGIALGIIAGCPVPLIEITPNQVKLGAVGSIKATKREMIEWAVAKYPDAKWLRQGVRLIDKNEHLADAVAVVHSAVATDQFRMAVQMAAGGTL